MYKKGVSRRTLMTAAGAAGIGAIAASSAQAQAAAGPQGSHGGSSGGGHAFVEDTQAAKKGEVRSLLKAGGDVSAQDVAGSGFTYRHDWGNKHGSWKLNLNMGGVSQRSRVFVAIGEGAAGGPDGGKFIGAAKYTLMNVAPRAGGVDIWVNIDWGSDIRIYVDYLVINP